MLPQSQPWTMPRTPGQKKKPLPSTGAGSQEQLDQYQGYLDQGFGKLGAPPGEQATALQMRGAMTQDPLEKYRLAQRRLPIFQGIQHQMNFNQGAAETATEAGQMAGKKVYRLPKTQQQ